MKAPLRIAILEADTPPDDIVARYGRYGKVFRTLLETAAEDMGEQGLSKESLELSAFDVVTEQKYPELEDVDAVLISGSSRFLGFRAHVGKRVINHVQSTTRLMMTRGSSSWSSLRRSC